MPKVKVTGLGIICAPGTSVDEAMRNMYTGARHPALPVRITAELNDGFPVFEIPGDLDYDREKITRTSYLAVHAAKEAILSSGLDRKDLDKLRIGVCIGTTVGCTLNSEEYYRTYRAGQNPENGPILRYLAGNPSQTIANEFRLKNGPVFSVVNACSSGTDAIGMAKAWIEKDICDVAIAGGADELSRITYLGFISLLIASKEACRPFDKNRSGLNLGEGAGIMVLERSDLRPTEHISPGIFLAGYGTFADAYHQTAPHPEGEGLVRAIHFALAQADIPPGSVGFVNAHGTSTGENDKVEGKTIARIFGNEVPVVSTKAFTGHTLGAAGGIEAVFTVKALIDQLLPATSGFMENDPECMVTPTTEKMKLSVSAGISNSLAFGGNNSTIVFKREN